jgi:hypothetical protein
MNTPLTNESVFADHREFDARKCARLFANFGCKSLSHLGRAGDFNVFNPVVNGGSLTSASEYGSDALHSIQMRCNASAISSTRTWISERISAANTGLMGGMFEMDCTARVRVVIRESSVGSVARVGFHQGHVTFEPNNKALQFNSIVAFTHAGSEGNWSVHLSSNGQGLDGNGNPVPENKIKRIDTGFSVDQFRTLHVWISPNGKRAKFYVDGKMVHHEIDETYIPRRENFISTTGPLSDTTDYSGQGGTLNASGLCIRSEATESTVNALVADWLRTRFFFERDR